MKKKKKLKKKKKKLIENEEESTVEELTQPSSEWTLRSYQASSHYCTDQIVTIPSKLPESKDPDMQNVQTSTSQRREIIHASEEPSTSSKHQEKPQSSASVIPTQILTDDESEPGETNEKSSSKHEEIDSNLISDDEEMPEAPQIPQALQTSLQPSPTCSRQDPPTEEFFVYPTDDPKGWVTEDDDSEKGEPSTSSILFQYVEENEG